MVHPPSCRARNSPRYRSSSGPGDAALAHDGGLTVSIGGITMPATVAAVLPRMPTAAARFLVADRDAVAALVDRVAPGTDPVTQVWIGAPDDDRRPSGPR